MDQNPDKSAPPSRKRNTAEACRQKATENLNLAVLMPHGARRSVLERSAAAWSMQAGQLQRQETRLAAELPQADSEVEHVRL